LESADPELALQKLMVKPSGVLLFDTLREADLPVIGKLIWKQAQANAPLFAVGSSGLEYALTAHWGADRVSDWELRGVKQTVAISGSCSPVTQRQIAYALKHGFTDIALHPARLLASRERDREVASAVELCVKRYKQGGSVILHTSLGPDDARVAATRDALAKAGLSPEQQRLKSGRLLGPVLGQVLRLIVERIEAPRLVVAGGDTSWFVANELGIDALEMVAPMAPGSPLCRIRSDRPAVNGREIVFKGGQVGREDFFVTVLRPRRT
jgi:uncharacterized protein YgbK (DUF1537 family)